MLQLHIRCCGIHVVYLNRPIKLDGLECREYSTVLNAETLKSPQEYEMKSLLST